MLLRPGACHSLLRGVSSASARPMRPLGQLGIRGQLVSRHCTWASKPMVPALPTRAFTTSLIRRDPDLKREAEARQQKLQPTPETVSSSSTVHPLFSEVGSKKQEAIPKSDVKGSIRADLDTIQSTFSLKAVPKDAMYLGLAGVLPYLATSLGTVFAGSEIKASAESGVGMLLHEDQAHALLQALEPLQVGYGAVILSFLGAIHWGLEWAGYGGHHGRRRYAVGVLAPAVAWPTLLLPTQEALILQFLAFTFLYNVDSTAASRGIAPPWYGTYRFVLTFIVGASIVVTLIGRSHAGAEGDQVPGPIQRVRAFQALATVSEEKDTLEEAQKDE